MSVMLLTFVYLTLYVMIFLQQIVHCCQQKQSFTCFVQSQILFYFRAGNCTCCLSMLWNWSLNWSVS